MSPLGLLVESVLSAAERAGRAGRGRRVRGPDQWGGRQGPHAGTLGPRGPQVYPAVTHGLGRRGLQEIVSQVYRKLKEKK